MMIRAPCGTPFYLGSSGIKPSLRIVHVGADPRPWMEHLVLRLAQLEENQSMGGSRSGVRTVAMDVSEAKPLLL